VASVQSSLYRFPTLAIQEQEEEEMRHNLAKAKLKAGKPISVVAPTYTSAGLVEMLGRMGFDAIFIDCEHGPAGWEEVENMVRAAELTNVTPIVRVQSNDPSTITRALDRGAGGVQVPHINTRAQAEAAVRAAKFAPLGHRGYAGGRAALGVTGNFTAHANDETMVVAMLEEVEALTNLDDILQVEHIDAFFIAPGDLAQSMGYPGQMSHPAVQSAVEDAVRKTHAAGRVAGVLTTDGASARRMRDLGARFIYIALANLLQPGTRDFLAEFK
jgi:4-hydroxy-2-oxoheptanedioate aldolase